MYTLIMSIVRTSDNHFYSVCYCTQTDCGASDKVFSSSGDNIQNVFKYKLFSSYIHSDIFDSQEKAKDAGERLIGIAEEVIETRRNMISLTLTFNI